MQTCLPAGSWPPAIRHGFRVILVAVFGIGAFVSVAPFSARAVDPCGGPYDVGLLASSDSANRTGNEHYLEFQIGVFNEIAKRTGCRFNLQSDVPRARQWRLYLAGHLPIMAAAIPEPERDAVGWYEKLEVMRNVMVLRVDQPHEQSVQAVLQDPNLKLGIVRSYSYGRYWNAQLADPASKIHREEFVDMQSVFHMMDLGRVDAVITKFAIYSDLLPTSHLSDRVTLIDPPENTNDFSGIYLSKRAFKPATAELIGRAIEAMRDDNSMQRIYTEVTLGGTGDIFTFTAPPVDFSN